jgi:hypothetical protein
MLRAAELVVLMAKRSVVIALLLLLAGFVPSTASAVTMQDIITLSKAGVSDTVLLALIDRDKSVFAIEANELVALKGAGVSEAVVIAMLKSGREPEPPMPAAPTVVDGFPILVIVGHGPDRPNTSRQPDGFTASAVPVIPYVAFSPGVVRGRGCVGVASGTRPVPAEPQLGRLTTDLGTRYLANGVGRIVNNPVVASVPGDAMSTATPVADCQQVSPPARPRSRR